MLATTRAILSLDTATAVIAISRRYHWTRGGTQGKSSAHLFLADFVAFQTRGVVGGGRQGTRTTKFHTRGHDGAGQCRRPIIRTECITIAPGRRIQTGQTFAALGIGQIPKPTVVKDFARLPTGVLGR